MKHSEYWAKREAEALKHYVTDEREYDRQIRRIYSDMLDACQTQIDGFYGRYATKEGITLAEAKKRVSEMEIKAYERKAARYVAEKDFSKKANEEMRLYNAAMKINRLEMLKANLGLELISGHEELEKFMDGILQGRTEDELKRQAGILGKTIKTNSKKAHSIVNASFHNATFSDRIWMYQDLMKADLSKLLESGLIQGKNPRVLARELKKTFNTSTFNAERLMRTELARVQTEAQKQSFERNGFDEYEFIANHGCCDICQGLNGKHFKVAKMMPGENAPPLHPHCRCSTAAYSDRKEYEEWLDFLDKGGTTEEYNKLKTQTKKIEAQNTSKTPLTNSVNYDKMSSEFTPAKSIEEAKAYAQNVLGLETTMFEAMNLDAANTFNSAVKKAYDIFGDVHKSGFLDGVSIITGDGSFVAGYTPSTKNIILLYENVAFKDSLSNILQEATEQFDMGFWSTNKAEHTIRHEVGHAIKIWLANNDTEKLNQISELRSKITKDCDIQLWSIDDTDEHTKAAGNIISYYALYDDDEFVAEAIAEYLAGAPRETAKQVVEILLKGR